MPPDAWLLIAAIVVLVGAVLIATAGIEKLEREDSDPIEPATPWPTHDHPNGRTCSGCR